MMIVIIFEIKIINKCLQRNMLIIYKIITKDKISNLKIKIFLQTLKNQWKELKQE